MFGYPNSCKLSRADGRLFSSIYQRSTSEMKKVFRFFFLKLELQSIPFFSHHPLFNWGYIVF